MKLGLRPSDVGLVVDPVVLRNDPTRWLGMIGRATDMTVDELAAKYLAVDGNGVRFAPSILPNAGLGVVTMGAIPAGTVITRYEGALVENKRLTQLRAQFDKQSEVSRQLGTHTIVLNLNWLVVGNFTEDVPPTVGGDVLTRQGLYYNHNPELVMRGKGLAGYMNTLYPNNHVHAPRGFNVSFELIEDRILYNMRTVSPGQYLEARWKNKPANFMMVAVAVRDIEKGEELFVNYGNPAIGQTVGSSNNFKLEPHMEITWHS